jgi:hypothetical protein
MPTKQPSSKILKDNVPYTPKHFLPISLTVLPKMISRLFLVIRKNQRIPTSVAIEQIVKRTQSCKD